MRRQIFLQPDYLLILVVRPKHWSPQKIDDVPKNIEVISEHRVASFGEAMDDLRRTNQYALENDLGVWAVVSATACDL